MPGRAKTPGPRLPCPTDNRPDPFVKTPHHALQHLRRPRLWLAGWLLGVLLSMQALGLAHASRHAAGPAGISAPGTTDTGFFGTHEAGGLDCQLYDQLAHGDLAMPSPNGWDTAHTTDTASVAAPVPPRFTAVRRFRARDPPAAQA
jgi:hypothetical protein